VRDSTDIEDRVGTRMGHASLVVSDEVYLASPHPNPLPEGEGVVFGPAPSCPGTPILPKPPPSGPPPAVPWTTDVVRFPEPRYTTRIRATVFGLARRMNDYRTPHAPREAEPSKPHAGREEYGRTSRGA
jgi:hypothetical protein